jgi:glucokinase
MSALILGVDIGGTKTAVGLADPEGRLLAREWRETAALGDGEALLAGIDAVIDAVLAATGRGRDAVARVGVGLPGTVDRARGALLTAQSLRGLEGVSLKDWFGRTIGAAVVVENDAGAAALGEYRFGAGRGARVMLYFTVSTGIGGGVVADGRLFRGSAGHAGEFGHQVALAEGGDPCSCGGHGCLESVASGPAIARRARRLLGESRGQALLALAGGDAAAITAATVAAAAREGDAEAAALWEETGKYLGIGVANAIVSYDADRVVLGGGVTHAGEWLLGPTRRHALARVMPRLRREVRIEAAALGDDVGIIGAVAAALGED